MSIQIDLTGKIALVTGANRGIGLSIATVLGHAGAFVIGTARTKEACHQIRDSMFKKGIKGDASVLDLSQQETLEQTLTAVRAQYGAPLIVVNNAGVTDDNLLLRMKPKQWFTVMKVNLDAVYYLSKWALRAMLKAHWGRIVNITSVVAQMGNPGQVNYCAAKAGLQGLTKSLAHETSRSGITVNSVAPGFIDTDMTRRLSDAQRESIMKRIPMGKMGNPKDIAHMVTFLVSDYAAYMTGQTLNVNGGMCMV